MSRAGPLIVMALCAAGTAQSAAPTLQGTYRADCAPYDGSAFIVTLRAPGASREFWLRANVPLAKAPGQWAHGSDSRPGSASIVLCATRPEVKCDYPQSGAFHIDPVKGGRMTGTFEARFGNGTAHRYRFTAAPASLPSRARLCG